MGGRYWLQDLMISDLYISKRTSFQDFMIDCSIRSVDVLNWGILPLYCDRLTTALHQMLLKYVNLRFQAGDRLEDPARLIP